MSYENVLTTVKYNIELEVISLLQLKVIGQIN